MNTQLIPLTNMDGIQAVMGRDLYTFLEVRDNYTDWMKRMIAYGFSAGQDFSEFSDKPKGAGRPRIDHILSLDMAKEISMIQRTDKGKQARQYFIECEKRLKLNLSTPALPTTYLEALKALVTSEEDKARVERNLREVEERAARALERGREYKKEAQPKIDAYDALIRSGNSHLVGTVGKHLGIGQNKLFEFLRKEEILISRRGDRYNTPYQKYMKYFEIKQYVNTNSYGDEIVTRTTYVKPAGMDFIRKRLVASGFKVNK